MRIHLSEVMSRRDEARQIMAEVGFASVEINGESYPVVEKPPIRLVLSSSAEKKVLIQAEGKLTLAIPCGRCLKEVAVLFPIFLEKEIDFSKTEEERAMDLDETCYITGLELDVDRLVYEEIILGFPIQVLCKEDCKGICEVCGKNRNEGECGCDRTVPDPRMSVIQDIFKNFKEV